MRKVVERFSHQAASTVKIVVENADGTRDAIISTLEHPFHVENWDATRGDLLASLDGMEGLPSHIIMPSDGSTLFGDWVKAGALKVGDELSCSPSTPNGQIDLIA